MKNKLFLTGMAALLLSFGLILAGCGDDDTGDPSSPGGGGGGLSWTAVTATSFGTSNIGAIAYGGDKFVAVGDDGKAAYSNNQE